MVARCGGDTTQELLGDGRPRTLSPMEQGHIDVDRDLLMRQRSACWAATRFCFSSILRWHLAASFRNFIGSLLTTDDNVLVQHGF
jgi:hypothetical protein